MLTDGAVQRRDVSDTRLGSSRRTRRGEHSRRVPAVVSRLLRRCLERIESAERRSGSAVLLGEPFEEERAFRGLFTITIGPFGPGGLMDVSVTTRCAFLHSGSAVVPQSISVQGRP